MKHIWIVYILGLSLPGFAQNKIALTEIASGFSIPVGIANAGDERLFIVEKTGYIRIMDTLGQVFPEPFLDIDAKVNSTASERGLLGLAFHPDYLNNGYFFLNYSNNSGSTVIARYARDTSDSNKADPTSEVILFVEPQPFQNHNGGNLAFGPDGYLYVGLGDGGSGGDPGNRAQNNTLRLGKMLRLDVDGAEPYTIPEDNPYFGVDTLQQEIWAYGLRNPWRYSFDRMTGDLWIADVGQDAWEEINFQGSGSAGGQNYGWRCREGLVAYNGSGCPPVGTMTDPVFVYAHAGQSCSGSVTGGYVYRGTRDEYLYGKYIFTDYCTGIFRSLQLDSAGNVVAEELANLANGEYTAFGEDASGELYVAGASGKIYTLMDLVSGIRDLISLEVALIPNPATDRVRIQFDDDGMASILVCNTIGEEVLKAEVFSGGEINTSILQAGSYVIRIQTEGKKAAVSQLTIVR